MAYTKTPMESTYQTKRVPMMFESEARAWNNQDTLAQNVLFELYKGEQTGDSYFEVIKRPGTVQLTDRGAAAIILGVYYSKTTESIVYAYPGNVVVTRNGVATTYAFPGMFAFDQNPGFTEFLYQDGTTDIIVSDGFIIASIDPIALTSLSTVNPVPNVGQHQPFPVYLDGYLFVADTKGNIWNSNLNDPLVFSPSNFLTAEAYPDIIKALVRVDNYIVALGVSSIEYFYDAANTNGSPLARYDSGSKPVGIFGIPAVLGNAIYFIGSRQGGIASVYSLENFKLTKLSNASIDRKVQIISTSDSFYTACNIVVGGGHTTLVVSRWAPNGQVLPDPMGMLQYDLETGLWTTLTFNLSASAGPIRQTTVVERLNMPGQPLLQQNATLFAFAFAPDVYAFSVEEYTDLGAPITVACRTRPQDFGTSRIKFMSRALYVGDQLGTVTGQVLAIKLLFNDRQDSYGYFTIPVESDYPVFYTGGAFRNVSYELAFEGDGPIRFKYLEIDYNQGDS